MMAGDIDLRRRHERLQGTLFAVIAILGPFALAFFFHPRTIPANLDHCGILRSALFELQHGDDAASKAAEIALLPLVKECPEPNDQDFVEPVRPVYRGRD